MCPNDDFDYFAHAAALSFATFPFYDKEFIYERETPLGSVGPGLMAAPFVFLFSLIDEAQGREVVEQRTQANIVKSWSQFGFLFATVFYFWTACFFLYEGLRLYVRKRPATLAIILMVLCQGMPLFAYRRPVFSHVYEFFCSR